MKHMHPGQMTAAPHEVVHEQSFEAIDGNRIDAQVASDRVPLHASPESVQYRADSRLYADSNLSVALPVKITHLQYTS